MVVAAVPDQESSLTMAAANYPLHDPTFDDGPAHAHANPYDTMSATLGFVVRDEHALRRSQARESGVGSGGGGRRIVDVETNITATQKMLAACSGSLLTSLLGVSLRFPPIYIHVALTITPGSDPPRRRPRPSAVAAPHSAPARRRHYHRRPP